MNPKRFFVELKRRNVYRAAVLYGMSAWLIAQITTQIFPFFNVPNSAVRFVIIALVLGFPIAMTLSWLYELTPAGLVRITINDLKYRWEWDLLRSDPRFQKLISCAETQDSPDDLSK
jgi:hypothetical protein